MRANDFRPLPDLASRTLAGSVVYANDELFAERENLIKPEPAVFSTESFGHKGKIYDGWETRRRREAGFDYAIVRLGVPGVIHGVVVDTAWFKGNYPPFVSVEATSIEGFPTVDELPGSAVGLAGGEVGGQGGQRESVRRQRPAPLHPRPADDLPGRRGGPVPGARRPDARPATADRHGRPRRVGERRHRHRLLEHVLLVAAEHPAAGPGAQHGRRLGERPPPGQRQRPRHGPAGRARIGAADRDRHVLLHRQLRRLGLGTRNRLQHSAIWTIPRPGSSWCRRPGCSPTPGTSSAPRRRRR